MSRLMLLGAHLAREHVAPVASVVPLDLDEVWLSAIEVREGRGGSDPAVLRQALEVRDQLLSIATFIAIRWGSAVETESAAREKVGARLRTWKEILGRHQGEVELTFKVGGSSRPKRPDYRDAASGGEYLRQLHSMRAATEIDHSLLDDAERTFQTLATRIRRLRRSDGGAEIALLVPRAKIDSVSSAGLELRERHPDTPFLLSGPWPLEVFADE